MNDQLIVERSGLADLVGRDLGTSGWVGIGQLRIDQFADATGDHQWIHTDAQKAAAGPFAGTIAHGFLTLSMLTVLLADVLVVNAEMGINYGFDRVRFLEPVASSSEVRASFRVKSVSESGSGTRVVLEVAVSARDAVSHACIADWILFFVD